MFDYLIVGAGFAGSVAAERLASQANQKILIIDQRDHIGGNAYDYYDAAGILVHKYGPHVFHTNSQEVYTYLSLFTQWRPYVHRVLTYVDGQLLPLPINRTTINRLYGLNLTTSDEAAAFFSQRAELCSAIRTSEDAVVSKIGRELYEKFYREYTRKQWGLDPSELDATVTSRLPIRTNEDDRYFTDTYQDMPLAGYTALFTRMLSHPNITLLLNTDYRTIKDRITYRHLIYTGPIDEFFDYCYGPLPYRSLAFEFQTHSIPVYQPASYITYPQTHDYTRITEFKYLSGQQHPQTSIAFEYPRADGDPYYPIPAPRNRELYKQYQALADALSHTYFVGRLATYQYYNMDQVVAQALTLFKRLHTETISAQRLTCNSLESITSNSELLQSN